MFGLTGRVERLTVRYRLACAVMGNSRRGTRSRSVNTQANAVHESPLDSRGIALADSLAAAVRLRRNREPF
jgi:hypothetical protein